MNFSDLLSNLEILTTKNMISWLRFDHPFAAVLLSSGELALTSFQMEFHEIDHENSFVALHAGIVYLILHETFYSGLDDSKSEQINLYSATDPDSVVLEGNFDSLTAPLIKKIKEQLQQRQ